MAYHWRAVLVLVWGLATAQSAQAEPFWKSRRSTGYTLGISLVANLGPAEDRKRFGVAADAQAEWFWHNSREPIHPAPLAVAGVQVGWTAPFGHSQVYAQLGPMLPAVVADGGFLPGLGMLVGGGLGMSSDGSAGPLLTASAVAPWLQGRFDVSRWQQDWHAPRLSVGPSLQMACCTTVL